MKFTRVIIPVMMLAATGFAQDVRYNFDKNANFEKFHTYKWVEIKDSSPLDQLTAQQLRAAFEAGLAKKGLVAATGDRADLLFGYLTTIGLFMQFSSYSTDFGYGGGWGGGWYGRGGMGMGSTTTTGTTSTIHVGEVVLDMYDPAAKQLVWRGTATKTLDPKAKPDKRQKNMAKAVDKLLKNYPPKVKA